MEDIKAGPTVILFYKLRYDRPNPGCQDRYSPHRTKIVTRTYRNPPLVELIAELRWGPSQVQLPMSGFVINSIGVPTSGSSDEELYMQFGALASNHGFSRFERLVPPGFPAPPHQVIYRYRQADSANQSIIYQLGNGVFTANATQPYKSWAEFGPRVREGLDFFRMAHDRISRPAPDFNIALVRYIDAFKADMMEGASSLDFLGNILGLRIDLPEVVRKAALPNAEIIPAMQFQIPVAPGNLAMNIAHGNIGGEAAMIMDMTVSIEGPISSAPDEALAALAKARLVIHEIFVGMTSKLDRIMLPERL